MNDTSDPAHENLSFHLRRMADQSMDAIDADRLVRASYIVDDFIALRAQLAKGEKP